MPNVMLQCTKNDERLQITNGKWRVADAKEGKKEKWKNGPASSPRSAWGRPFAPLCGDWLIE
jgi:hypothetical protein